MKLKNKESKHSYVASAISRKGSLGEFFLEGPHLPMAPPGNAFYNMTSCLIHIFRELC